MVIALQVPDQIFNEFFCVFLCFICSLFAFLRYFVEDTCKAILEKISVAEVRFFFNPLKMPFVLPFKISFVLTPFYYYINHLLLTLPDGLTICSLGRSIWVQQGLWRAGPLTSLNRDNNSITSNP